MKESTKALLRDTIRANAKFRIGDRVVLRRRDNVSKKVDDHFLKEGNVIGYRDYYPHSKNYGGNRYYVRFEDGYEAGIFPSHLNKVWVD